MSLVHSVIFYALKPRSLVFTEQQFIIGCNCCKDRISKYCYRITIPRVFKVYKGESRLDCRPTIVRDLPEMKYVATTKI